MTLRKLRVILISRKEILYTKLILWPCYERSCNNDTFEAEAISHYNNSGFINSKEISNQNNFRPRVNEIEYLSTSQIASLVTDWGGKERP